MYNLRLLPLTLALLTPHTTSSPLPFPPAGPNKFKISGIPEVTLYAQPNYTDRKITYMYDSRFCWDIRDVLGKDSAGNQNTIQSILPAAGDTCWLYDKWDCGKNATTAVVKSYVHEGIHQTVPSPGGEKMIAIRCGRGVWEENWPFEAGCRVRGIACPSA